MKYESYSRLFKDAISEELLSPKPAQNKEYVAFSIESIVGQSYSAIQILIKTEETKKEIVYTRDVSELIYSLLKIPAGKNTKWKNTISTAIGTMVKFNMKGQIKSTRIADALKKYFGEEGEVEGFKAGEINSPILYVSEDNLERYLTKNFKKSGKIIYTFIGNKL